MEQNGPAWPPESKPHPSLEQGPAPTARYKVAVMVDCDAVAADGTPCGTTLLIEQAAGIVEAMKHRRLVVRCATCGKDVAADPAPGSARFMTQEEAARQAAKDAPRIVVPGPGINRQEIRRQAAESRKTRG